MLKASTYTDNVKQFIGWMDRLSEAVTEDYRSPLFGELTRKQVFQEYLRNVPLEGPKFSEHMSEREHKEAERILTPWSERPPWSAWGPQTVASYYAPKDPPLNTLETATSRLKQKLGSGPGQPWPLKKAYHQLPSTTSSGLPWLVTPWKKEVGSEVLRIVESAWANDDPIDIPPSMPMWRVDPPGKVRFAWAESKIEAIAGAPFVYPLIADWREIPEFVAWKGPNYAQPMVSETLQTHPGNVLSIDYSTFDQTQSPKLIRHACDIMHEACGYRKPNFFKSWVDNLVQGPVLTPDRELTGYHGIPSGSVATNMVDTINNMLCIEGYLDSYGIDGVYFALGDDAVIIGEGVDPVDFAEFATGDFGFVANPDKQFFSTSKAADFLQMSYYVENGYKPTYPVSRVAWRMIGYERHRYRGKDWNEWGVVVRTLQQLQNAINNPSIDKMVEWIQRDGDRLKLGADEDPQEILELAGKPAKTMTEERARWDPGAEESRPFREWEINKLVRRLARRR
jgi:hypothetical protein